MILSRRLLVHGSGVLLLSLGALGLAACGNDDDPSMPPADTPTATPDDGNGNGNGNGNGETPEPATPTPAPEPTPTPGGPIDGTVEPGGGSTADQSIGPIPSPATESAILREVRMGVHDGWDRIVFEFEEPQIPRATLGYVSAALECGTGNRVDLPGSAILVIRMDGADAHDEDGEVTVNVRELEGYGDTILLAKQTCDFEAQVAWHLGIVDFQRFKVTTLESPARLVIDVEQ
jgi:hypothetical protein